MSEIVAKGTERPSDIQLVAHDFAQRLKYMLVNGKKLSDQEVYALAQYASATGLDPFAGECWIIPGKGVCPGIAGWRKKAQEQLEYEAKEAKEDGAHFWIEYADATLNDCVFDSTKGDIAYVAVLRDTVSQHRWRKSIIETTDGFMKMGAKFDEALKEAKALVGDEPIWMASGVVFNSESFTYEGGVEKFDRKERTKKRAEKSAIRKRFPRIHLPEAKGVDDVAEIEDYAFDVQEVTRSSDENIKELGYGDDVEHAHVNESTPDLPEEHGMVEAAEVLGGVEITPAPKSATTKGMPLEEAMLVGSDADGLYVDMDIKELTIRFNSMNKTKKAKPEEWTNTQSVKMAALKTLIEEKSKHVGASD